MSTASNPSLRNQVDRLIDLGVHELAGRSAAEFRAMAAHLPENQTGLVIVHSSVVNPSALAPLLTHGGKPGFVVEDMVDLDEFEPIPGATPPDQPLYFIADVQRGDDMLNWSPEEALVQIESRDRRPLTISEGISWLLQDPNQLEPGRCFMTIASRRRKTNGLDARTPAIWISNGTGRDGPDHRDAPKVGWCWARNRHTWLGFASAARQEPRASPR